MAEKEINRGRWKERVAEIHGKAVRERGREALAVILDPWGGKSERPEILGPFDR